MKLEPSEKVSLRRFAQQQGKQWRLVLQQMWESGTYWGTETDRQILQALRNRIGPTGLHRIRPKDLA